MDSETTELPLGALLTEQDLEHIVRLKSATEVLRFLESEPRIIKACVEHQVLPQYLAYWLVYTLELGVHPR